MRAPADRRMRRSGRRCMHRRLPSNPGIGVRRELVDRPRQAAMGDVGDSHVLDDAPEIGSDGDPHAGECIGGAWVMSVLGRPAADACEWTLHSADDVGNRDVVGRLCEPEAAVSTAVRADDPRVAQLSEDVLQEVERNILSRGDALGLYRSLVSCRGKLDCSANRVVGFGRDPHTVAGSNPYASARSGSFSASISASETITLHCFQVASSCILPSIMCTPRPSGIASSTFFAKSTSSTGGEKTFFAMSICAGCSDHAPTQPRRNAARNWYSQPTVSLMSPNGP